MRVKDLRNLVEVLIEGNQEEANSRSFLHPQRTASYAKKAIVGLTRTLETLRESREITTDQNRLLLGLESLQNSMQSTHLQVLSSDAETLWDWLERSDGPKAHLAGYQSTQEAGKSLEACKSLEKLLYRSCGRSTVYGRMKRWLGDTTLGHISQMRIELIATFRAEQMWVETADHTKLDCIWVPAVASPADAPTMLFCNPNGGFYEFSNYQSEWLEFYTRAGVNIVLWNYRGYGRTKGRPTPTRLKQDGVAIAEYLKRVRGVERLGVHGESMGGMVAAHVARQIAVDFLFADRTFCSLDAVARFGFGAVAYRLFRLLSCWDSDTAKDYMHAQCYKLVSSDPSDTMITDLASLKTGVALRLFSPSPCPLFPTSHILSPNDSLAFFEVLTKFTKIVYYFNKRDGERSPRSIGTLIQGLSYISGQSNYHMLGPDTDAVLEDEVMLGTIYRLFGVVGEMDAGGKSLTAVCPAAGKEGKEGLRALQMWLIVLDKWGSYSISMGELSDPKQLSIQKCRTTILNLTSISEENQHLSNPFLQQLFSHTQQITYYLSKVLAYLEAANPETPAGRCTPSTDAEQSVSKATDEFNKAGYLLPLTCGHSGPLSVQEKAVLELHLSRVQFRK